MRLRKECEHGRYDAHGMSPYGKPSPCRPTSCPGGEFLPEGALVHYCKTHNLLVRWADASNCVAGVYTVDCNIVGGLLFLDALASQVGESE